MIKKKIPGIKNAWDFFIKIINIFYLLPPLLLDGTGGLLPCLGILGGGADLFGIITGLDGLGL
jgi:hypothetical protein